MSSAILDASAILAVIGREKGVELVTPHLPGALVSTVNLAEVFSKASDKGVTLEAMKWMIEGLRVETVPFDEQLAYITGSLRDTTRSAGLSFGDRACLALGQVRRRPVLTAETRWSDLALDIEVVQIASG